ncbi:MAG: hypothetical protein A3A86_02080 [Elusimicrobia bacterium RIFCSPLOWO2_01_FULL_60_11]|nr:MAG: hypothetical protein A3A86_02080 [Elusimicrobia bacterium RIFCSPLOWO2_01_FULL_60_11]
MSSPSFHFKRFFAAGFLALASAGALWAGDDWQFWQEASAPVHKRGKFTSSLTEHTRYQNDMKDLYFFFVKSKNAYAPRPWLNAAVSYGYFKQKNLRSVWLEEHRPEVEASPRLTWKGFTLENRARVEARLIEKDGKDAVWRYRNRFQASLDGNILGKKAGFFVNEEIFYDFTAETRNQNRVFAGVKFSPAKRLSISLSWGVQSVLSGSRWESRQLFFASVGLN